MRLTRFVVPLVAVAAAVFGTLKLMEQIAPYTSKASTGSSSSSGGTSASGSLFKPANTRKLLANIASEAGSDGQITLFRLQSNAAQAEVSRPGGATQLVVFGPDANVRVRLTTHGGGFGQPFHASDIDPNAPERIVAAIKHMRGGSADVDYMVYAVGLIDSGGAWDTFLKDASHSHFHAGPHGRSVNAL